MKRGRDTPLVESEEDFFKASSHLLSPRFVLTIVLHMEFCDKRTAIV